MISVCYSGNSKIFEGLALSILSMVKHCNEQLDIMILSMDVTEQNPNFTIFTKEQIEALDNIVKEKNPQSKVRLVDVTNLYKEKLMHGKNANSGYTPYTMLRLLLDLLPNVNDKLIYIDVDTMCCKDIKELYDVNIDDYEFGAVKDHMGKIFISPKYCNAGVLLLNMKKIKETGLFEKAREQVNKKKMIMPDQSAIHDNAQKKLFLPRKFNEQRNIREDTVVKHFCKAIKFGFLYFYIYNYKQWQRDKVHQKLKITEFDDVYEKYDSLCLSNLKN